MPPYIVIAAGSCSSTTGRGYSFQLGAVLAIVVHNSQPVVNLRRLKDVPIFLTMGDEFPKII